MKYFQKFSNGFEPGTSMKLIQALYAFCQSTIHKIKRENLNNERLSKKVLSILDNLSFWEIFFLWESKKIPEIGIFMKNELKSKTFLKRGNKFWGK